MISTRGSALRKAFRWIFVILSPVLALVMSVEYALAEQLHPRGAEEHVHKEDHSKRKERGEIRRGSGWEERRVSRVRPSRPGIERRQGLRSREPRHAERGRPRRLFVRY